jgi:hypothetical protein
MDIKEIHNKLDKQCPADYKINEIILFAYPYRRVIVNATVNKSPEQSLQQIYTVLLQTIKAGFDTESKLIEFLGLTKEDFILRELYFLRERGYADLVSDKWIVTEEGNKFIKDNSILKILEEDEFEFLIDAITDEAIEKEYKLYSSEQTENKLEPVIKYNIKEPDLLKGKHEQLSDIYKKINNGKAYLVDYDINKIKFDKKEYNDYYLIEYIPRLGKENDLEAFIEIRNNDKNYTINKRLTKILMQKYPAILYEFTNSDRKAFAELSAENEINEIVEFEKINEQIKSIPETQTLSIWETQAQFEEALRTVKKKILIESPWIKKATLKYIELFEKALNRKVQIIILYGIKNNDEHDYGTMKKLEELSSKYKSLLYLIHLPTHFEKVGNYKMVGTHRKLVIKDTDYYIQGSFNFLSFNKKEGQKVANEESILISKNVEKKWNNVIKEYKLEI